MQVQEIMTRDVAWCTPQDTLETVAQKMWDRDCGSVPVCAEDGHVLGMVTDRDICMHASFQDKPLSELVVQGAMSQSLLTCQPGDSIAEVERVMQRDQLHRLPVLDDSGALAGIVSLADIAREAAREREQGITEIVPEEVGMTISAVSQPPGRGTSSPAPHP